MYKGLVHTSADANPSSHASLRDALLWEWLFNAEKDDPKSITFSLLSPLCMHSGLHPRQKNS